MWFHWVKPNIIKVSTNVVVDVCLVKTNIMNIKEYNRRGGSHVITYHE